MVRKGERRCNILGISSDNTVSLLNLTDNNTQALVNTATVSGVLSDQAGTSLYSFSLASTGSGGNYQGTIPASTTATLQPGLYTVTVTAVALAGKLTTQQVLEATIVTG